MDEDPTKASFAPENAVLSHRIPPSAKEAAPWGEVDGNPVLADLRGEWDLFNHGLMLSRGRFDFDPVAHFVNCQDDSVEIAIMGLDEPIFDGIGEYGGIDWDRTVLLVRPNVTERLLRFLGRVSVSDFKGFYAAATLMKVCIADPTHCGVGRVDVPVYVFGATTPAGAYVMVVPSDCNKRPFVKEIPPDPLIEEQIGRLNSGESAPLEKVQPEFQRRISEWNTKKIFQ